MLPPTPQPQARIGPSDFTSWEMSRLNRAFSSRGSAGHFANLEAAQSNSGCTITTFPLDLMRRTSKFGSAEAEASAHDA